MLLISWFSDIGDIDGINIEASFNFFWLNELLFYIINILKN